VLLHPQHERTRAFLARVLEGQPGTSQQPADAGRNA
jgi:hypothetical protein